MSVAGEQLPVPRVTTTRWQPALHRRHVLPAALGLLSVVLLMWAVRQIPDPAELQNWGLLGLFFVNMITSASIVLPLPGFAANVAAGAIWHPLLVGIVSGLGSATGEMSGYIAGRSGSALFGADTDPRLQRIHYWMERHGFLTVFVIAALPLPLFDFAGIAAGAAGYSPVRFWLACALGKSIKLTLLAMAGGPVAALLAFFIALVD